MQIRQFVKEQAMIRTIFKYFLKALAGLCILIAAYILIVCILSLLSTRPAEVNCKDTHEIFIISNAVHLNLTIPVHLLDSAILRALNVPADVQYLSFGWGDKAFYMKTPTWDDLKAGIALRAVFVPSSSAIHTTYYRRSHTGWISLALCDIQLARLNAYINNTFDRDSVSNIIEIPHTGYTDDDRFFEAHGRYSLFNTCNDWVNKGLKEANIRTSLWSPFKYGVLYHVNTPLAVGH